MEKIKQAMEKARERQRSEPARAPATETSESPARGEASISYSTTRVVTVGPNTLKRNRILTDIQNDDAATAYKILRTQVEQRMAARNWNALAVTSPGPNEGKTLTAINLSVALAREMHRTVLLVDLDLRNPSIHERFELGDGPGLVNFLLEDVPLSEILVNPGMERLVLLPAGRKVPNSSELIASPRMLELVEELKSRYASRIIVFDLPPLLSTDDALAFAPYVDATLMVIEDGSTTRDELANAVEMLGKVTLLGTVLNKSTEAVKAYPY